jgi:hypothetical protein
MKLRRRGFMATLAALAGGKVAAAADPPEPTPPEPTDVEKWLAPGPRSHHWRVTDDCVEQIDPADEVYLGVHTADGSESLSGGPTGGNCLIRGGNGSGTGYAGAPVHISGSVYLDPATDQLMYSDGGRWTPIVAGSTKD